MDQAVSLRELRLLVRLEWGKGIAAGKSAPPLGNPIRQALNEG